MPPDEESGTLRVLAGRGGTVPEICKFLTDLEAAYVRAYHLQHSWLRAPSRVSRPVVWQVFAETGLLFPFSGASRELPAGRESILPTHTLVVSKVSISSPGFWEVVGSLNPLQQIREFLNDRHKRRQDQQYRELAESDRLALDNELVQRQIWEKDNSIFRERVALLRDIGFSDDEIRQIVWSDLGKALSDLGRHQDTRLIEAAK